jgi:SAM domain (Sterile alpha motif)
LQQIAEWLETLGMSEYAQRFAENDIDFEILSELTDHDLEKIGVVSLGYRRKLLRAIANLETTAKATLGPVVAPVAEDTSRRDTAERRQVTVMFSDLVGSTALSARMDPEDLREVISAYQKCVADTVRGLRRQIHGRWCPDLFRIPNSPRRRCRASRARGAGVGCCRKWSQDTCNSANSCGYRHRACGGGRPDRLRRGTRAWHRGRDAEPCRALQSRTA